MRDKLVSEQKFQLSHLWVCLSMEVGEFGGRFHRAFGSILGPMRPKSEHTESYSIVYGIINCEGRKGQNHNRFGLLLEW